MSIIQTGSFSKDLIPLVNKWFGMYPEWDPKYSKIFRVEKPSDRNYEEDATYSGMGRAVIKPEGSGIRYDSSKQLYNPRYTHNVYGLGFIITEEMMDDGIAFKNAKKFTEMLKRSCMQTREIVVHDILNRAITSGYVMEGGDGVVLGSASHPTSNGNVSNMPTNAVDISEAALEQAAIDIRNMVDDRGLRINLEPRKIVCNIAQEFELDRILKSQMQVDSASHNLNALRASATYPDGVVLTPYLTDTDAWIVLTNCPDGLKFYDRKAMAIKSDGDFDTDNAKLKAQLRFYAGWSDFRHVYYSAGG